MEQHVHEEHCQGCLKTRQPCYQRARINQFRQYHDVVSILDDFSLNNCFGHEQFMLLEDDFQLCENALIEHIPKIFGVV